MNLVTDIAIPESLDELLSTSISGPDIKLNPHLFPLYLFQLFYKQRGIDGNFLKENYPLFGGSWIAARYSHEILDLSYSSWIFVKKDKFSVMFGYEVGAKDFVPTHQALYGKSYAILYVTPENKIHGNSVVSNDEKQDFGLLFSIHAIALDIFNQVIESGLKFSDH